MSTTLDIPLQPRSRVSRSAAVGVIGDAEKAAGIRSVAESAVMRAVKSGTLRTVAAVARAADLSEPATTKALRSLAHRALITRTTDNFGSESFAARR